VLPDPADRERALRLLPATAFWAAWHLFPGALDRARSIRLARDAEALWDPGLPATLREFYDELQRIQTWALFYEARYSRPVETVALHRTAALAPGPAARIREIVGRELARQPRLTYDLRVVAALAGVLEGRSAPAREERERIRSRTRRALEELLDPAVVEAEKRKALRHYEAEDVDATREFAARALEELGKSR
jgi:hypothetical protein